MLLGFRILGILTQNIIYRKQIICIKLIIIILGTLAVLYLFIFVVIKSYSWGINLSAPTIGGSTDFSEFYKNTFPATSGMLTLSLFIHNIIITIMRNNENQKHNASIRFIYPSEDVYKKRICRL